MKIKNINDERILFDNGSSISYDKSLKPSKRWLSYSEHNYADFKQLDDEAMDFDFIEPLDFEITKYGFKFGNKDRRMFFIPCYSEQNGYYTIALDIVYSQRVIQNLACKEVFAY